MGDDITIRYAGVEKRLGRQQVLRGVDLEVRRGECLVVIGRTGVIQPLPLPYMERIRRLPGVEDVNVEMTGAGPGISPIKKPITDPRRMGHTDLRHSSVVGNISRSLTRM